MSKSEVMWLAFVDTIQKIKRLLKLILKGTEIKEIQMMTFGLQDVKNIKNFKMFNSGSKSFFLYVFQQVLLVLDISSFSS